MAESIDYYMDGTERAIIIDALDFKIQCMKDALNKVGKYEEAFKNNLIDAIAQYELVRSQFP